MTVDRNKGDMPADLRLIRDALEYARLVGGRASIDSKCSVAFAALSRVWENAIMLKTIGEAAQAKLEHESTCRDYACLMRGGCDEWQQLEIDLQEALAAVPASEDEPR